MVASRLEVGAERSVIGLQKGRSGRPSHTGCAPHATAAAHLALVARGARVGTGTIGHTSLG
jgi:hypothetical protein